jgi:hypothetical protein
MAITHVATLTPTDNSGATTVSGSIDCTGTNTVLVAFVYEETGDTVTGVDFNGVALTKVATQHMCYSASANTLTIWYLIAPASGSHTLTATRPGTSSFMVLTAQCVQGAAQTGQPDASTTFITGTVGSCGAGATSLSSSLTTIADNAWIIGSARFDNGGTVAGTGAFTKRAQGAAGNAAVHAIFDTNGTITPPASTTIGANGANAGSAWVFGAISIKPAGATTATGATMLLMSV